MWIRFLHLRLLGLVCPILLFCQLPSFTPASAGVLVNGNLPGGRDNEALSKTLRAWLLQALPDPLYEVAPGWGHTAVVPRGIKWNGKILRLRPEIQSGPKNDGTWRKIRLSALDPATTLQADICNVRSPSSGKTTFTVSITSLLRLEYTHQNWKAGLKWYDASVRARLRAYATLDCELSTRLEPSLLIVPDVVINLHIMRAQVGYGNLVVEHVMGVGGEGARLIGDWLHDTIRELRPDVEHQLLSKGEAAVLKAGRNKEIRLSLLHLSNKIPLLDDIGKKKQ
jgi:hypothetical protein